MIAQWVPDIFRDIVGRIIIPNTPVYFDYGHYKEVAKNLIYKDISESVKNKKYPLVWLVLDMPEDMDPLPGQYSSPKFQLIIATGTDPNWTIDERRDGSYLPFLYPVYNQLIDQMRKEVRFGFPNFTQMKHQKVDRYYWGGDETPGGAVDKPNLFNDHIDAIQLRNFNIKINTVKCVQN